MCRDHGAAALRRLRRRDLGPRPRALSSAAVGNRPPTVLRRMRPQTGCPSAAIRMACAVRQVRTGALGMTDVGATMRDLRRNGLFRELRVVESAQGPVVRLRGRDVVLLCSNDYLGLAGHPSLREAVAAAAERWGAGAGASRLVSGNMRRTSSSRRSSPTSRAMRGAYSSGRAFWQTSAC